MSPRTVLTRGLAATALALGLAAVGTTPALAADSGPYRHSGFSTHWHCQISMRATAGLGIEILEDCTRAAGERHWSYTYRAF